MFKKEIRAPILSLTLLSLGGLLLHVRIHPPSVSALNSIPLAFGLLGTFVLPFLFNFERTALWAFVLTVAAVVVGTILMTWYSVTHWVEPVRWDTVLLKSTLADIVILAAKIPLGLVILRHFRRKDRPA